MALKPITVTQLNDYVKRVLMTDPLLGNVTVTGEISNLKYHSSGHVYFSVSDAESKVNCFFPASYVKNLRYELDNGLEVVINGYINVYTKGGSYTLFARSITVSGEGNLAAAFQLMKEKLDREGLFDAEHKKPIPAFPKHIGVVTSETGAAVRDIIKTITLRNRIADITVFPTAVQGEGAAEEIAEMIRFINSDPEFSKIDTLIVGRGGGSAEDLWAFNEEVVARAIYDSKIPVISAVGHEIDFSISDFAADARAATPTAAAEMAVPDTGLIEENLEKARRKLSDALTGVMEYHKLYCTRLMEIMQSDMERRIENHAHMIEKYRLYIEENNPLNIMKRGYSVICFGDEEENGLKIVSSSADIEEGRRYRAVMADGNAEFTACNVTREVKK